MCFGQDGGPLKFLGIPIDGTEVQFATKLKAKGFTYNTAYESYKGHFNGKPIDVYIHTNHNLVDRVYVAFPYTTEESIRVEFNRLLAQFKDTSKYMDLSMNEEIPADDDISYEITVNIKRYQAGFNYYDGLRSYCIYGCRARQDLRNLYGRATGKSEGVYQRKPLDNHTMSIRIWPHKPQMSRDNQECGFWCGYQTNEHYKYTFPGGKHSISEFEELIPGTGGLFSAIYSEWDHSGGQSSGF